MNRPMTILKGFTASASRVALILPAIATIACFSATVAHAAPAGWNQVWSDEFTGTTLDTTKWDAIFWNTPFNNEQQAYRPDHVTVAGGNLELTADDHDVGAKVTRRARWKACGPSSTVAGK